MSEKNGSTWGALPTGKRGSALRQPGSSALQLKRRAVVVCARGGGGGGVVGWAAQARGVGASAGTRGE